MIDNIEDYGKSKSNPILLNSIQSSLEYISSLVTREKGLHLIAHRIGSVSSSSIKKPIDKYEVYRTDGLIDKIFISVYAKTNILIPPNGYLFESNIIGNKKIADEFIYTENYNNDESIELDPIILENHLMSSIVINMRYKNFPKDMILDLYDKGELFGVKNINELILSLK
jgi:hypothetical protein